MPVWLSSYHIFEKIVWETSVNLEGKILWALSQVDHFVLCEMSQKFAEDLLRFDLRVLKGCTIIKAYEKYIE